MADGTSTVAYRYIKDFPGYRVGDDGSVWSCWVRFRGNGTAQKSHMTDEWQRMKLCWFGEYLAVDLYFLVQPGPVRRTIHRLVLEAFVGMRPKGMQCRHFPDRDVTNNRLANLQWGTIKQNMADKIFHGTSLRGERNHQHKVTADAVRDIRLKCAAGDTQQALADRHRISRASVSDIVCKRTWTEVA